MLHIDDSAPSYQRSKKKLIDKRIVTNEQLTETLVAFKINQNDYRLRAHHIVCKHDKNRFSITIMGTQYRILGSYYAEKASFVLVQVLNHDDYERVNRGC